MKKEIVVNANDYLLLELLNMMVYCKFNDNITNKINELKNIIQNEMFGDMFEKIGNRDIVTEELKLKYTFE